MPGDFTKDSLQYNVKEVSQANGKGYFGKKRKFVSPKVKVNKK